MRNRLFLTALLVAAVGLGGSRPAVAADYPALPDGGSVVTSSPLSDGGIVDFITVDTAHLTDWVATLRCDSSHGSPRSFYRFSADGGTARPVDALLDLDRTFDLPVTQTAGVKVRWLSFLGEDGGAPYCTVHHQIVPSE